MAYYLVKQVITSNLKHSFKVFTPLNLTHLEVLIKHLTGNIYVYLVNPQDNSNQNLTNDLGKTDFNYPAFRSNNEKILKSRLRFSTDQASWVGEYITFYSIEDPSKFMPKNFFCNNRVTFPSFYGMEQIDLSEFDYSPEKIHVGVEYEKSIGQKYESFGYKVEYRGINFGKQDGGIDLIAENADNFSLVQCKNWIETDNYQIDSKDLRAFIGDCYLYLLQNSVQKKVGFHFIISDH